MKFRIIFYLLLSIASLTATFCSASPKLTALYNSLDPHSISQHLAFYELYPDDPEGKSALQRAWVLLSGNKHATINQTLNYAQADRAIQAIINLVNKQPQQEITPLEEEELLVIEKLAEKRLHNRNLKGYYAKTEQEVLNLSPDEVDLGRGLFLTQMGENNWKNIRTYEALLDLMALQILSRLNENPTAEEKIAAINHFIFEEMAFRFPPHSAYAKDVDLYTFLPSVLDSHRGVCLGVSILYLCMAQRLNLHLEMITPPGHIYVRYKNQDKEINIETTARGIHLDSETYLGLNTRSLQQRNIKEVIGLAHFNQASVYWIANNSEKSLSCYAIAQKYLPEDKLLKELMGYNFLLVGEKDKGEELLRQVQNYVPDYALTRETLADDYLRGKTDIEGLKAIFMHVDETRESVLTKKKALEQAIEKYPDFRGGIFNLAATLLQLHRQGESLQMLQRYHDLEPNDPTAEYYLAVLYAERRDDNKSWAHLRNAERITAAKNHKPKALKELRKEITLHCPE